MRLASLLLLLLPLGLVACVGNAQIAKPCLTAPAPAGASAQRICDPDPVFGPQQDAPVSR